MTFRPIDDIIVTMLAKEVIQEVFAPGTLIVPLNRRSLDNRTFTTGIDDSNAMDAVQTGRGITIIPAIMLGEKPFPQRYLAVHNRGSARYSGVSVALSPEELAKDFSGKIFAVRGDKSPLKTFYNATRQRLGIRVESQDNVYGIPIIEQPKVDPRIMSLPKNVRPGTIWIMLDEQNPTISPALWRGFIMGGVAGYEKAYRELLEIHNRDSKVQFIELNEVPS